MKAQQQVEPGIQRPPHFSAKFEERIKLILPSKNPAAKLRTSFPFLA
jgi:hypothetical protein